MVTILEMGTKLMRSIVVVVLAMVLMGTRKCESLNVNVVRFGAKGDGRTDCSRAFAAAWVKACGSGGGAATVVVPSGRFLVNKAVLFSGPCKSSSVTFRISGTILGPANYRLIASADSWISFNHVDGLTISGGVFDARGAPLWSCKKSGKSCPTGATTLGFSNSKNIRVSGVTTTNSQMFQITINGCTGVRLERVRVSAPDESPNTDGIHVQMSRGVTITDARIGTGDDCISVGPGMSGLWIERLTCGPGHGFSIGSLGKDLREAGVENVTIKGAVFSGTQNGLRIKTWGRASNGFARGILFDNVVMSNVENPILIDQNYCPEKKGCPGQASGVGISDVTYNNVRGTSATPLAVKFECSSKRPCRNIKLRNVKLTYKNRAATASCSHAAGSASGLMQPSSCL